MAESKKPIIFNAKVSETQYKSAFWNAAFKAGVLQWWPLTLLADLLAALVYWQILSALQMQIMNRYSILVAVLLVAVPVVYFIYGIFYTKKRIRYYWKMYRQQGEVRKMSVHRTSVVIDTEAFCSQIPFSDCKCLVVKKDCYVLVQSGKSFIIIPKSDVPEKYRKAVDTILKRRFSAKNRKKSKHRVRENNG